jgi:argininosuccinate lyase
MDDHNDRCSDTENILLTLDQLSQTIDVMTSVLGRLRSHVQARAEAETGNRDSNAGLAGAGDQVLH